MMKKTLLIAVLVAAVATNMQAGNPREVIMQVVSVLENKNEKIARFNQDGFLAYVEANAPDLLFDAQAAIASRFAPAIAAQQSRMQAMSAKAREMYEAGKARAQRAYQSGKAQAQRTYQSGKARVSELNEQAQQWFAENPNAVRNIAIGAGAVAGAAAVGYGAKKGYDELGRHQRVKAASQEQVDTEARRAGYTEIPEESPEASARRKAQALTAEAFSDTNLDE